MSSGGTSRQAMACSSQWCPCLLLSCAVLMSQPLQAWAEAADDEEQARQLFQQAIEAFRAEQYPTALMLFQRSQATHHRASTLLNIGMTQRALFDFPAAIDTFRQYLVQEGQGVPTDQRSQIERFIQEMEAAIIQLTVTVNEPGAMVLVDGREVGASPLGSVLRLRAGPHVIEARLEGFEDAREEVTTEAGQRREINLELMPPEVQQPTTIQPQQESEPPHEPVTTLEEAAVEEPLEAPTEETPDETPISEDRGRRSIASRWWFWTLIGVVVVGGATTAGVLLAPDDEPRPGADFSVNVR